MTAVRFGLPCALALTALLFGARSAHADPLPFSFVLEATGVISGAAGETIGWGYSLTNDTDAWLEISGLDAGAFEHGTPDASVFDFPILAPHTTRTVSFASMAAGLFQLTWDDDAPGAFTNSGVFVLSANVWDGDPFAGGVFLEAAAEQSAAYSASVALQTAPVPEPATSLLVATGIALAALGRRRRPR